jgi:hypothetical protein
MTGMTATPADIEVLRRRQDDLLGRIHSLTRGRDLGEVTLQDSMAVEGRLVAELGQIQDRLSALGEHLYDGCATCRPSDGAGVASTGRTASDQ